MHESIGRTQTFMCGLDPARATALHLALGRPGAPPGLGDPMPAFWHQIYFWDPQSPAALGRDGHPATGPGLIPNLGLPMRMWAGGQLLFHSAPVLGHPAEKTSTVERAEVKEGRTGRLGFVTLRHDIVQDGRLCITERQDLVYRDPPDQRANVAPPKAEGREFLALEQRFDPVLLFRYSALTLNGHRIHYDADYARDVEGYSGLVVHGPLLAQCALSMAEDLLGPLSAFSFRARSPVTVDEAVYFCLTGERKMLVRTAEGRLCMDIEFTRVNWHIPLDLGAEA
ncbi:acyl dehydratase [Psychromarinibacter sp. S121]|uniref:acyl dehydratase n=1 Tax=Psychromarinibacter sp. S121 TaxID=3415127 RepID=UPI003C7DC324